MIVAWVPTALAEPAPPPPYPAERVLRPLVLPKALGRLTLDSAVSGAVRPDGSEADLWSALGASLGLGQVEVSLSSAAWIAPDPGWAGIVTPEVRVLAADGPWLDVAPALAAVVRVEEPGLELMLDPGVRWVVADRWSVALGHGGDPRILSQTPGATFGLLLPVPARLVVQASDRVALGAETTLLNLRLHAPRALFYPPEIWEEPNLAIGVDGSPNPLVDLRGAVGGELASLRYGHTLWWTRFAAVVRF